MIFFFWKPCELLISVKIDDFFYTISLYAHDMISKINVYVFCMEHFEINDKKQKIWNRNRDFSPRFFQLDHHKFCFSLFVRKFAACFNFSDLSTKFGYNK